MKRWGLLIIFAITIIGGVGYLGFQSGAGDETPIIEVPPTVPVTRGDVQQTVTAPGNLVGTRQTTLSPDVGGRMIEINAQPGDAVKSGDVLARLDTRSLEQALIEAQLKLTQAEAEHDRELADAQLALQDAERQLAQARLKFPDLTSAEIRLRNAQDDLTYAQDELNKALNRPWEPDQVLDNYRRAVTNAADALAIAQSDYDSANGSRSASGLELSTLEDNIARARIKLEGLQQGIDPFLQIDVDKAQAALDAATLVAPYDGVVLEVNAIEGDNVNAGVSIILLSDPSAVEIEASVIEEDLPLVKRDQSVELFFDAVPDAIVSGRIARIVPQRIAGDRPLYPVYVALDELPEGLAPGMTADASIVIDGRDDVLRLPRAVVRARSDNTAIVSVWLGNRAEERTVQVGLRGDQYVEILSGLREGDLVVSQ